jgi:hypothetical protein
MMHRNPTSIVHLFVLFVVLVMLLGVTGCSSSTPSGATPDIRLGMTNQPVETSAEVATPVATPTPSPGLVILVSPAEVDAYWEAVLQPVLAELAAQEGLQFETRQTIQAGEIDERVRLVVVLSPDPGISGLAASRPTVQFVAVGIADIAPGANISVIAGHGDRADRQGFLAGYLAAVITTDWRVGVISRSDTPDGKAARQAFINGAVFFCGLCRPAYPPFNQYPLYAELPAGASPADQQAAAGVLLGGAVKTVYVAPGAGDLSLLQYLAQAGINLIAGVAPPDELGSQWVATLRTDLAAALRQAWPDLMAGKGGLDFEPPLVIENINESLLSVGRQRLVEKTLSDLEIDYIDTGIDPLTGEAR